MKTILSLALALSALVTTSSFITPSQKLSSIISQWECPYCGHINPHTVRDCQKCES